jgi:hypothetical protein
MRALLCIISLACIISGAVAVEDADVLFFAPFEDTTDAAVSRGAPAATPTGEPRFDEGVRGRAVVLDADSLLSYVFAGNVVPSEGTIMMWFKPEWPADDDLFHRLFYATTGNDRGKALNSILLYKYGRWSRLMLYTADGQLNGPQAGRSMAYRNEMVWEPGTWHHVAATWSATLASTKMYLYFDGERIAACGGQIFLPETAPEVFEIGGPEGSGATWFDDIMVFGRPLMAREVKSVYDGYAGEMAAAPSELPFVSSREMGLRPFMLFGRDQLVVLTDYRGARHDLGDAPGTISVTIANDVGLSEETSAPTDASATTQLAFELERVGPGPVNIAATLRDGQGNLVREGELAWTVPATPEWVGNDLGKTDEVLPPWTPVIATGDAVEMWGRRYEFANSPLPSAVSSGDRAMLRAPISMTVRSGGADASLTMAATGPPAGSDAIASRDWQGALGPLTCSASTSVEFDGFMRVDLELTPAAAVDVEGLELIVAMPADIATLYHHAHADWTALSDTGAVGDAGWSLPLEFVPYMWLGDEAGGLAWWCESDWNWTNADPTRAVELRHTDAGVDLVVRFIEGETTLAEPLKLTFGFMATPVKPLPEGWRDWRPGFISTTAIEALAERGPGTDGYRDIGVLWNNNVGSFSYLPADPAEMKRKVDLLHGGGWQTVVSYFAINQTQTGTPDYVLCEQEWRRAPYSEQTMRYGSYATVCAASTWQDMMLWAIDQTMEQTGTDGVYLDCSSPRWCASALHGCGHGRFTILATRELQKRIYALVHGRRGDAGFVYNHNSENNMITQYSFTDVVLNGEQFNRKDLATLTRAKFRAEFIPHSLGVPSLLLPTLVKFQKDKQEKMPGAEFLAFPLLHDVICLPSWMARDSQKLLGRIRDAMVAFGVADAEFLPYWSNAAEIKPSSPDATISAYLRADGKALLLIAQGPEEPLTLMVELRDRLAAMTDAPARDALSGEALQWQAGKLQWSLPGRAVQLAIVELAQ